MLIDIGFSSVQYLLQFGDGPGEVWRHSGSPSGSFPLVLLEVDPVEVAIACPRGSRWPGGQTKTPHAIGEHPDNMGAPPDFTVDPLEHFGGLQVLVMPDRRTVEREGLLDPAGKLGTARRPDGETASCFLETAPVIEPAKRLETFIITFAWHGPGRFSDNARNSADGRTVTDSMEHSAHPWRRTRMRRIASCSNVRALSKRRS